MMKQEQRHNLRFSKRLRVQLEGLDIYTSNVSSGGVQIVCPDLWMSQIQAKLDSGKVNLVINLASDTQLVTVCRVAYVSSYDDEYLIGVEFSAMQKDEKELWDEFISLGD